MKSLFRAGAAGALLLALLASVVQPVGAQGADALRRQQEQQRRDREREAQRRADAARRSAEDAQRRARDARAREQERLRLKKQQEADAQRAQQQGQPAPPGTSVSTVQRTSDRMVFSNGVARLTRPLTAAEMKRGFTGKLTSDGRALVKFNNRIFAVPASRVGVRRPANQNSAPPAANQNSVQPAANQNYSAQPTRWTPAKQASVAADIQTIAATRIPPSASRRPRGVATVSSTGGAAAASPPGGSSGPPPPGPRVAANDNNTRAMLSRQELLEGVSDETLKEAIEYSYRATGMEGDGGTADAIRYEKRTGKLLSPAGHTQKGREIRRTLSRLLQSGKLSRREAEVAKRLDADLEEALSR